MHTRFLLSPHTQQHSTEHACQCGKPCRSRQRTICMTHSGQGSVMMLNNERFRASTKLCPCQEKFTIFRVLTPALSLETLSRSRSVLFVSGLVMSCVLFVHKHIIHFHIHTYTDTHVRKARPPDDCGQSISYWPGGRLRLALWTFGGH